MNKTKATPKVRVVESPLFRAVRTGTSVLQHISPSLAASAALMAVTTNFRQPPKPVAAGVLATAAKSFFDCEGYRVATYKWGEGPSVLLLHGWGSQAADMAAFVAPLIERGFSVVAIDAPGHGASTGWRSNLRLFGVAAEIACTQYGPFVGIVGHSVGATAAMLALKDHPDWSPDLVLLSAQAEPGRSIKRMVKALGLSSAGPEMLRQFESYVGAPMSDANIDVLKGSQRRGALLIHDAGDKVIPIEEGKQAATRLNNATFHETRGLGHYRVLTDAAVTAMAANFLSAQQPNQQPARARL